MLNTNARVLRLSPEDNILVAGERIDKDAVTAEGVVTRQRIPFGHKLAAKPIAVGEPVKKFGQIIGFASQPIAAGDWVHEHNCNMGPEHGAFERDYDFCAGLQPTDFVPEAERATFEGFRRSNGKAGTRNYLGILTSVNCSATVAKFMAEEVNRSGILDDYPTIDGVVPFVHGTGCAMDLKGEGFDVLRRTQWGYTSSPNLGGALLVGLGCEAFQIGRMKEVYGIDDGDTFQTMTIQEIGGTKKMIEWGVERIKEMLPIVARARRETLPASEITLALQCGGSDGYSGITANPALGVAADLLVRQGGTAILSETPEIYGAEHLLTRRAVSREVGEKLIERHQVVGGLHRAQWRRDEQQPVARQQARRADDHSRKVARRGGQGRHDGADGGLRICRAGHRKGLRLHGHAGLRPGFGDRPGGRRRQRARASPPAAARPMAASRCRRSSSPPTRRCTQRMVDDMDINCGDILEGVSLADKGQEILTRSSPSRRARSRSRKSSATATTSSCPGRSAR